MSTGVPLPTRRPSSETWLGHPRGLAILFSAELWERFSYYGMRALLVLYVIDALDHSSSEAYALFGVYGAVVYTFGVVGGWLAQRFMGTVRAIVLGGALMATGHLVMALPWQGGLYWALALLCVGNGLFKPNVSSTVGALYDDGDPRKPHAFYLFYMGINLGAMLAPILCSAVSDAWGWHYGFGLAGVGMGLGLVVVIRGRALLESCRGAQVPSPSHRTGICLGLAVLAMVPLCALLLSRAQWGHLSIGLATAVVLVVLLVIAARHRGRARKGVLALLVLMVFHTAFWAAFEQVGSSFTVLADAHVDRDLWGWTIPAPALLAINGALIIALAPVISWLWRCLAKRGLEPGISVKFALGLALLGAGFLVLALGIVRTEASVALVWVVLCYLLMTVGELCLSPVGLAMVTELAPRGMTSFCMGAWFLTYANGHLLAGWVATKTVDGSQASELMRYADVFGSVGITAVVLGMGMLLLGRWLDGMIGAE